MQSPEILLQDLNTALRELRGAAHLLGGKRVDTGERVDTELLPTMRRLLLAEVLGTKSILAIGGSQGAGKTTLLRAMYGLEGGAAEWLQPNEGRGERLPVLVLEDAARMEPQGAIRQVRKVAEGQYRLVEDDVDVPAFQKAVNDPDPEVLLPVLKVPQRYFNRPNQVWLLLPGYEKQDRQNKSWQELMRQALIGAAGCVIVTDETRLANQQQVEIVKDMLSKELRGAQPLVVISKTEAARGKPERLQELRATAGEVFGLAAEQRERWVVCAGSDDPKYVDEWLPLLSNGINDLAIAGCGDRKAQLARLEDVLSKDLTRVLGLIHTRSQLFFQQREGGEGGPREVLQACLEAFDEARDGLRVEYHKNIGDMLDAQFATAWQRLQERLINDHEGFFNQTGAFFDKASEVQQRIESDVAGSWGSPDVVMAQHTKAIGNITQKKLGASASLGEQDASLLPGSSPLQRLGYVGADQKPIRWQRLDENEGNLRVLLAGRNSPTQGEAPQRLTKDFERSVKLLPALTLEYARLASLMPAVVGVAPKSLMVASASEQHDLMNQVKQQLDNGVDLGQTVLRSIATILTVDIAADGEVDVVKAFLNALSPETVATAEEAGAAGGAAAIGGVGAAVVGMVAVGYLTYSALRAVRQQDENGRVAAHAMLMNVKEHHQRHFLHHFDQMMDEVRTRLRQALRERYHLDEALMEKDRLAKAIADVRTLQRDLLDELGRSGRTLALFNVESAA